MTDYSSTIPSTNSDTLSQRVGVSSKRLRRFMRRSTLLPFIIVGIALIFVVAIIVNNTSGKPSVAGVTAPSVLSGDKRADVGAPKAKQEINRVFSFPLKDQSGKEVSKFSYEVQNAELRDEIVVKGEKATAIKGRTFLIINLKITNNYDKSISLNVRDYMRLTANNSAEKLAPDIHNDPVEVQAISTKYTRVGFPINDTDKNLTLQIGEISGSKQPILLNLK